jgi:outer membrane autotransporter protein
MTLTTGDGGAGGAGNGAAVGGNGAQAGALTMPTIDADVSGALTLTAGAGGAGGDAGTGAANGGDGAAGRDLALTVSSTTIGSVAITDGDAGATGATGTGTAGAAGAGGNVTLTFDHNDVQSVTGAVTVANTGDGIIVINNDDASAAGVAEVTFTGQVGTSAARLGTFTLTDGNVQFGSAVFVDTMTQGASLDSLDFNGDVTITNGLVIGDGDATFAGSVDAAITVDTGDDITFDGTGTQIVAKAVTAGTDTAGNLTVSNATGTVVFNAAIGATGAGSAIGTMTLADSSDVEFNSTVDVTNLVLGAGTVRVNGLVAAGGTITLGDATGTTTIRPGINFDTGNTVFTVAGNVTDNAGTVNIVMPSTITGGETLTIVDGTGGVTDGTYTVSDTAVIDYTVATSDANDTVIVTAAARPATAIAAQLGVTVSEGAALGSANIAVQGDAPALTAMNTTLTGDNAGAAQAAGQVAPQAELLGAGSQASSANAASANTLVNQRTASLRGDESAAGFAAGGDMKSKGVWFRPFASMTDQDAENGIAGYESRTHGIGGGFDAEVSDTTVVGIMGTYSSSDVDGEGVGNANLDINSTQVGVYGGYTGSKFTLDGLLSYGWNSNDSSRVITFGGLNRTAAADYNSNQIFASVSAGMPLAYGSATVTPRSSISYLNLSTDTYTETGAGGLNLTVNQDDVTDIVGTIGAGISTTMKKSEGDLVLSGGVDLGYDLDGDAARATSTFTGGGAAFTTEGQDPAQFSTKFDLGVGWNTDKVELGVAYQGEVKSGFLGHNVSAKARFNF